MFNEKIEVALHKMFEVSNSRVNKDGKFAITDIYWAIFDDAQLKGSL